MKKFALCLTVVSTALVGCKAMDAADATLEMKKKTGEMASTTDRMSQTTKEMQGLTEEMKHDMTLAEAKKLMDDPESTRKLSVPSDSLMAGAKKFAKEIYLDELEEWIHVAFENLYYTKDFDQTRSADPEYVKQWDHEKGVIYAKLQAVASQLPQKKVEALIQSQIFGNDDDGGGVYPEYVCQLLAMRAYFIQTFYLNERGLLDAEQEMNNLAKAKEALMRMKQLEFLVNLPFYERLKYSAVGFKGSKELKSKNLDVSIIKMSTLWESFWNKMGEEMPEALKSADPKTAKKFQQIRDEVKMLQDKAEALEESRKIHS